ncbi:MAG: ribosomal protein [Pseudobdellovibrio sp.]|jgi:large subunit ribosomal protein L15|nr:ribosomal protein [Pseudobdellovibrio sp.]
MSLLSKLAPKEGSTHYRKRIGRGIGSGMGGTSTMGHKGQIARAGGRVRRGFEGGQTPLSRRLPKFGFTNVDFATNYQIVNLSDLSKVEGNVDSASLYAAGLVTKGSQVKILAKGEVKKAVSVKVHFISAKAKEAIEKAGGKVEIIPQRAKYKRASK